MANALWNYVAYYLTSDIVISPVDGFKYSAILNNQAKEPSVSPGEWALVPTGAGIVDVLPTGNGSGITVPHPIVAGVATVETNLFSGNGSGITLTPSGLDTSIAVATNLKSANGSGITITPSLLNTDVNLSTNLVGGAGITITPSGLDSSIILSAPGTFTPAYGGFISTLTQGLTPGTPLPLVYNTITASSGTSLVIGSGGGFSGIQVSNNGTYKLTFSIQWDKFAGGGTNNIQAWIRINGGNEPFTNSEEDITQQINVVMTVDFVFTLAAGSVIEVIGFTPLVSSSIQALANPIDATHPVAIPSIITNINRIA